jgi:hypothetical protein
MTWEFIHGSFFFCPSCIVHAELMIQKYCELRACLLLFFIRVKSVLLKISKIKNVRINSDVMFCSFVEPLRERANQCCPVGKRATAFDEEAVLQSAKNELVNVILLVIWLNRLMVSISTRQKNHVLNHTLLELNKLCSLCLQVVED